MKTLEHDESSAILIFKEGNGLDIVLSSDMSDINLSNPCLLAMGVARLMTDPRFRDEFHELMDKVINDGTAKDLINAVKQI